MLADDDTNLEYKQDSIELSTSEKYVQNFRFYDNESNKKFERRNVLKQIPTNKRSKNS